MGWRDDPILPRSPVLCGILKSTRGGRKVRVGGGWEEMKAEEGVGGSRLPTVGSFWKLKSRTRRLLLEPVGRSILNKSW